MTKAPFSGKHLNAIDVADLLSYFLKNWSFEKDNISRSYLEKNQSSHTLARHAENTGCAYGTA
jgi:hypothetical protein